MKFFYEGSGLKCLNGSKILQLLLSSSLATAKSRWISFNLMGLISDPGRSCVLIRRCSSVCTRSKGSSYGGWWSLRWIRDYETHPRKDLHERHGVTFSYFLVQPDVHYNSLEVVRLLKNYLMCNSKLVCHRSLFEKKRWIANEIIEWLNSWIAGVI